jgi:hypothetical protein
VFREQDVEAALDLLEVMEFAWHDSYAAATPSEVIVVDDVLVRSGGQLGGLVRAVRMARVWAGGAFIPQCRSASWKYAAPSSWSFNRGGHRLVLDRWLWNEGRPTRPSCSNKSG